LQKANCGIVWFNSPSPKEPVHGSGSRAHLGACDYSESALVIYVSMHRTVDAFDVLGQIGAFITGLRIAALDLKSRYRKRAFGITIFSIAAGRQSKSSITYNTKPLSG
jgi:hypothetical protein